MPMLSRRRFAAGAGATLAGGWFAPTARAAGAAPFPDIASRLSLVDPELRVAARTRLLTPDPEVNATTLAGFRRRGRLDEQAAASIVPRLVPGGRPGDPDVPVYVVNAAADARRPAILHMHGGGFVFGDALSGVPRLRALSAALDCVIVSVEYRLAPEATFAASTRDTYAALKWLYTSAGSLGVDRARIAVMGDSAGGGHAALLAQAAHDRGEVPIAFQALIYPMLDDRTGSLRRPSSTVGTMVWTAADNRYGWTAFLGGRPGAANVPTQAAAARRADVSGLPPAFIGVGSIDLFVDEDVDYARRLIDAGVATELHVVPGAFHAFDIIAPDTGVARRFTAAKIDALRRAFGGGPTERG